MKKLIIVTAILVILTGCGTRQNDSAGVTETMPNTTEMQPITPETVPDIPEIIHDMPENTELQPIMAEETSGSQEAETALSDQEFQQVQDDIYILAKLAMAEAEGEGLFGKAAVVRVALNRVQSPQFPDTVAEVVFQPGQFCTGEGGRYWQVEPDEDSYLAVEIVLEGWNDDAVKKALYFESSGQADVWHAQHLEYTGTIGNHNFYR